VCAQSGGSSRYALVVILGYNGCTTALVTSCKRRCTHKQSWPSAQFTTVVSSQALQYVRLNIRWLCGREVPPHHVAITVNQELGKVPFDVGGQQASLLLFQEGVQRRLVGPIDVELGEQRKLGALRLREALDLLVVPALLLAEPAGSTLACVQVHD
jgi:hypothetical protein